MYSLTDMNKTHDAKLARMILWLVVFLLTFFVVWAYFTELDEVAIGEGRVVTSDRVQMVRSSEGGVVVEMKVRENQRVEEGEVLAILDPSIERIRSRELEIEKTAEAARHFRLDALINELDEVIFPDWIASQEGIASRETSLFHDMRRRHREELDNLRLRRSLLQQEYNSLNSLVGIGAAAPRELLQVEERLAEVDGRISEVVNTFRNRLQEENNDALRKWEGLEQQIESMSVFLNRRTIVSPASGIVKELFVGNLAGDVVPPGGQILSIVPDGESVMVEALFSPRDIAFVFPGQPAVIKVTAYDYAIYGALEGVVDAISADSIFDEVRRDHFFRGVIRLEKDHFAIEGMDNLYLIPGMVTTAEVQTGSRTVMNYLLKPLRRAQEAFRER